MTPFTVIRMIPLVRMCPCHVNTRAHDMMTHSHATPAGTYTLQVQTIGWRFPWLRVTVDAQGRLADVQPIQPGVEWDRLAVPVPMKKDRLGDGVNGDDDNAARVDDDVDTDHLDERKVIRVRPAPVPLEYFTVGCDVCQCDAHCCTMTLLLFQQYCDSFSRMKYGNVLTHTHTHDSHARA